MIGCESRGSEVGALRIGRKRRTYRYDGGAEALEHDRHVVVDFLLLPWDERDRVDGRSRVAGERRRGGDDGRVEVRQVQIDGVDDEGVPAARTSDERRRVDVGRREWARLAAGHGAPVHRRERAVVTRYAEEAC